MSEPDELEEDFGNIMGEEGINLEAESPEEVKKRLKFVNKELEELEEEEMSYLKRLLKYGLSAWIFGLSAFFFILMIYKGPEIIFWNAPPLTYSLLLAGAAAPLFLSGFFIRRYHGKMSDLSEFKRKLVKGYENMVTEDVDKNSAEDVGEDLPEEDVEEDLE